VSQIQRIVVMLILLRALLQFILLPVAAVLKPQRLQALAEVFINEQDCLIGEHAGANVERVYAFLIFKHESNFQIG
jgi:hypothetical protein